MNDIEEKGYNACYEGTRRDQNPYNPSVGGEHQDWDDGYAIALGEIEQDNWDAGDREDFDSGRWTNEDERSMNAGRDIPLRNEAGEWMV